MFEFSLAKKYLFPRWRQLSVSIISLISITVISLVVWLIVVFFSVTHGLEHIWINKLIALTAPARVTPTEAYYQSYYNQIDGISALSDYTMKSLEEKHFSPVVDPYDPHIDEALPSSFPPPDRAADGTLKDLVKELYASLDALSGVKGLEYEEFDTAYSTVDLHLIRSQTEDTFSLRRPFTHETESSLSQPVFLGSFSPANATLDKALLPLQTEDINNLFQLLEKGDGQTEKRKQFVRDVELRTLRIPEAGWLLPSSLLNAPLEGVALLAEEGEEIQKIYIPTTQEELTSLTEQLSKQSIPFQQGIMGKKGGEIFLQEQHITPETPLLLYGPLSFPAHFVQDPLPVAQHPEEVMVEVRIPVQGRELQGDVPIGSLKIDEATISPTASIGWMEYEEESGLYALPIDSHFGEGILLPKSFRDAGALVGDRGFLLYYTPTATTLQEQHIPVFVAGFYDPGIIPIGGKFLLVEKDTASLIRSAHNPEDPQLATGVNLRFTRLEQADMLKEQLVQQLEKRGILPYFTVETYREYEFTKDLIQQLSSEKNLYSLLATVIIIVACSNIVSMLIILVNDKKHEIGILRSMGATSFSIALIFGTCGVVMGALGSLLGTGVAMITLAYLEPLIGWMSYLQGYEMFNASFYGDTIPNELSIQALTFVFAATSIISLVAGLIPAIKACRLRPSAILRAE